MSSPLRPIAITAGEPAGIGMDIILDILKNPPPYPLMIYANKQSLLARAEQLSISKNLLIDHDHIHIQSFDLAEPVIPQQLNVRNAPAVLKSIQQATQDCMNQRCRALVTAPIHKGIINDAGIPFTGHTEYLADFTHTAKTVMMLATTQLKVALATTHLALSKVPAAITEISLTECIDVLHHDLKHRFKLDAPRILVCGLNPHAGEGGHLGNEEIHIIKPTIKKLQDQGYHLKGPVPADTAFTAHSLADTDVVLAMYHDQGLPVIKAQGFGETVNITLGLPIVRTSVDHGVALTLAGTGKASSSSLMTALHYADQLTA